MSENAKVVLALLLILVLMGLVGAMDYEDALREERERQAVKSWPPGDCSNVAAAKPAEDGSACVVSLPGR
jgi:hypothetical protein